MKCPICGKQTLPGAKLCSPCRAALKRAKDDSVWELPPSQRPGEPAAPAAPTAPEARAAQWVLGAPRLAGWRMWVLAAGALVVCASVALRFARSGEPVAVASATPTAIAVPAARTAAVESTTVPLQRAIPASTQPMQSEATAASVHTASAEPHVAQPPRAGEHPAAVRPKPKSTPDVPPPPVAPPVEPAPAPVVAAAPPPVRPVRAVDPWQQLNDALARCGGQDFFNRPGCEYRARATHCAGHWGEVPQCPAGTSNDHGQ